MDKPARPDRGLDAEHGMRQAPPRRAAGATRDGRAGLDEGPVTAVDRGSGLDTDVSIGSSLPPHSEEREAAIRAWEAQCHRPLLAEGGRGRRGVLWVGALMLAAAGGGWFLWHGRPPAPPRAGSDATIPERRPVPKLREAPASAVIVSEVRLPASAVAAPATPGDGLRSHRDELALQREEQARKLAIARLKSAILVPGTGQTRPTAEEGASVPTRGGHDGHAGAGLDKHANDPNARFADHAADAGVAVSTARRIGDLEHKVLRGKWLEAVLVPRAVSNLPGTLCATVQRDVYGERGRVVLIPWGSRVCGIYRAELRKGQDRLFAVWQSLRRPDGVEVALDSVGTDQLGSAGMGGHVDTHFAQIFGISALLSIIGAGAANAGVASQDAYNSGSYYRQSVQQAAAQSSQHALQPYLSIPPTVTVPAGERIRILVNRDLDFSAVFSSARASDRDSESSTDVTFLP